MRLRTSSAVSRAEPGACGSSGWTAEGAEPIRQRKRAALRSAGGRGRSSRPWARPALAAKSSRRVATKDGAAAGPRAAQTAPDFSVSSSAHKASASRAASMRISRSWPRPSPRQPQPNGRPCSLSQALVATKAKGRASAARTARPRAKARAAGRSWATAGATSSRASGAGKALAKSWAAKGFAGMDERAASGMFLICSNAEMKSRRVGLRLHEAARLRGRRARRVGAVR